MESNILKNVPVSCIVPVYNAEKFLREFLDSMINQSFQDVEIICVDDASTDSSLSILYEYKRQNEMIILQNKTNLGAAESRNKGLRIARGEYVVFLDCDDIMHLEMLESMYNVCRKEQADICVGYLGNFGNGKCSDFGFQERNKEFILTYPVIEKPLEFQHIFQVINNCPYDKMIRRKLLLDHNIEFQNLPRSNDIFFAFASVLSSEKIVFLDKVIYYYHLKRDGSITSTWMGKKDFDCEAFDAIFDFMNEKGIYELVKESFTEKVIKDIYVGMFSFSEKYRRELINNLKNVYLSKWEILEQYDQNLLTALQKQIVDIIMEEKELVSYNTLLLSCSDKKLRLLIDSCHTQGKKIVWWGAGKIGLEFLSYFRQNNLNIDYVVDNDLEKQGTETAGYEISDWDSVKGSADVILVTNYGWIGEIKKQIGVPKNILNIISYLEHQ